MSRKHIFILAIAILIGGVIWRFSDWQEAGVSQITRTPFAIRQASTMTPISSATQINIPLSIGVVGSPTPTEGKVTERFPGFSTVEILPDDILMPGEIQDDGTLIDSLAVFGIGGGPDDSIGPPQLIFGDGSVVGNHFPPEELVIIELVRPDESVVAVRIQSEYPYFSYCFDNELLLQPGRYALRVTTNSLPVETHWFNVSPSASPRVFLSKRTHMLKCVDTLIEGQPTRIFFDGFQPNERVLVALYHESGNYEIIKTWTAQVDDSGRLVQEIRAPRVKEPGSYGIAVFGQNLRETRFQSTEPFYASAATSLIIFEESLEPEPLIVHATITPRPVVPTSTPSFCSNAPEPRVDIGDSIRVTYTDGTPLRLRSSPEVRKDNIVELIPEGTRMTVLDGPECAPRPGRSDSFVFWKVRVSTSGLTGWVAEGDLYNYYIEKYP